MTNNRKAIFFDVDGTLWDKEEKIPPSTIKAIHQLQTNGHLAFICTGRTRAFFKDERLLSIGFDGIVSGCGTTVEYGGVDLFYLKLTNEAIREALPVLRAHHIQPVMEGRYDIYLDKEDFADLGFLALLEHDSHGHVISLSDNFDRWEASKMTVVTSHCVGDDMDQVMKKLGHLYDFKVHHFGIAEMVPKGYHKGSGIQIVCDHLGIPIEDTIAVGDGPNDLDMLRMAGTGVAMGNATEDARAAADYVTADLHDAGIWKACEHLGLL